MIMLFNSLQELSRLQKVVMYNCFTTEADINLFADTLQIEVTINSANSLACDLPHGIFVSLQVDSLGLYEPKVYVKDFDYNNPAKIIIRCLDASCSNIKNSKSGTVVIETKTKVTYIPAGSVRVSKGVMGNCFHDNDSFVELQQGAAILVLYPTAFCQDSIASIQGGVLKINPISRVKLYITQSDGSRSIFNEITVTAMQQAYVPTSKPLNTSTAIRIKLEQEDISKYFIQKVENGQLTKDSVLFQANIEIYTADAVPILKSAQVTMNLYKLMGISWAYDQFDLQILQKGFISLKKMGAQATIANNQIKALGITYYTIQYIFTYYDVAKTNQFRMRLFSSGLSNFLYNVNPTQNTCEARFPGQNCLELVQKLSQIPSSQLKAEIVYFYYKNDQYITNYTKVVDHIYGSCFTDGLLDYDVLTQKLNITFEQNFNSSYCSLLDNDLITIKILLGNNSQLLLTKTTDFVPGKQQFQVSGFNLTLKPEIRVQYFKSNLLQDAIALDTYIIYKNNKLLSSEIIMVAKILSVNLACTLLYLIYYFIIDVKLRKCIEKKQSMKKKLQEIDEVEQQSDAV
ncbi:Conserved_hypothetical protein [Hexamita inflata]|uniref:Transmembrane protein n=1 Tax=Hexamita inflata TaxID=28002 RepID=A0AA86RB00_9EUKA|nr:Conserved hypothetical protein [Hexamita inflata]